MGTNNILTGDIARQGGSLLNYDNNAIQSIIITAWSEYECRITLWAHDCGLNGYYEYIIQPGQTRKLNYLIPPDIESSEYI